MERPARPLRVAVVSLTLAAALAACSTGGTGGSADPVIAVGKRPAAPTISGTGLDGQPVSTAGWQGRVVVLNFWGSWCAPCRAEAPDLKASAADLAPSGVRFLGVDVRDDRDKALAFQRRYAPGYPSIFDPESRVGLQFTGVAPRLTPSTVVIDRNNRVAALIDGGTDRQELLDVVHQVAGGS